MRDIVCISHLRWDFVWQRPQQLLSGLGQHNRIVFVEEPVSSLEAQQPYLEIIPYTNTLTVLRLVQPLDEHRWIGHGDPLTQDVYEHLLQQYLHEHHFADPVLWLYTPMALDFVDYIPHQLLLIDVMDQLSAFKDAPPELVERERQVLLRADLVLTGGSSLYQDKRPYNTHTYLFPSGVDVEHFAQAVTQANFNRPPELDNLTGAVIGYFGVIDERIDIELLRQLAEDQPEWNIILIGPVVKIDPAALPQAPNLHYLGARSYEELPQYLAYFDVTLIPFALNEATRFLSPTKTLEYMAAHKPIVSTPIHDVVDLYGEVVRVGYTPNEIKDHIQSALAENREAWQHKEDELLARYDWDRISQQISDLIESSLARLEVLHMANIKQKLGKTG